jgi:hypothetical protein
MMAQREKVHATQRICDQEKRPRVRHVGTFFDALGQTGEHDQNKTGRE